MAALAPMCATATAGVTVRNIGEAAAPAGVVVGVYAGSPASPGTKLGSVTTTRMLYPAEAEPLELPFATGAPATVFAIVDDGAPPHPAWTECRTDDNKTQAISPACGAPK